MAERVMDATEKQEVTNALKSIIPRKAYIKYIEIIYTQPWWDGRQSMYIANVYGAGRKNVSHYLITPEYSSVLRDYVSSLVENSNSSIESLDVLHRLARLGVICEDQIHKSFDHDKSKFIDNLRDTFYVCGGTDHRKDPWIQTGYFGSIPQEDLSDDDEWGWFSILKLKTHK